MPCAALGNARIAFCGAKADLDALPYGGPFVDLLGAEDESWHVGFSLFWAVARRPVVGASSGDAINIAHYTRFASALRIFFALDSHFLCK